MSQTTRVRATSLIISAAAASAALVVGLIPNGSSAAAAPRSTSSRPATTIGSATLAKANLPAERDLAFHRAGDWQTIRSSATLGRLPVTDCFYARNLEQLGASTMYRRDYRLGEDRSQRAYTIALEFRSDHQTRAAYTALKSWVWKCPAALTKFGYARASAAPWAAVAAGDRAAYTVVDHAILDRPNAEEQAFEEFGLTRSGRRVALVIMKTTGQDYNWSSVPSPDLTTYPSIRSLPKIAKRLSRDLTASRHLSDKQLITASQVPAYEDQRVRIVAPGLGRRQDVITVCTPPSGVRELGASQVRSRSFRFDGYPPSTFTLALQYPDAAAAKAASRTFRTRIGACGKQLREDGYWVGSHGPGWIKAPTTRGSGRFTELVYKEPGHADADEGYFESVGITRVRDRLMITVSVVYGQDYNVSLKPQGDPETGLGPHPQFALIKAAAKRLAS